VSHKIAIRIPNWIGDAVMFTPSLESILENGAVVTLIGTYPALSLFDRDKKIASIIEDDSKKGWSRVARLYSLAKKIGKQDIYITTQNTLLSALLGYFSGSKKRVGYKGEFRSALLTHSLNKEPKLHQALKYHKLAEVALGKKLEVKNPYLCSEAKKDGIKRVGINPGAAFGSAKRWDTLKFAQVAKGLSHKYEILLFGSKNEEGICRVIESELLKDGIAVENLCGKTTVHQLIDKIATMNLFITNDSGPMHIANAFDVPLVAIFGSTDHTETHPFGNGKYKIVRKDMECSPCKKRTCPLKHHRCMEEIGAEEVLEAVNNL